MLKPLAKMTTTTCDGCERMKLMEEVLQTAQCLLMAAKCAEAMIDWLGPVLRHRVSECSHLIQRRMD
ncbi:hypothetical protein KIN20_034674 [Parelaphostrongylus tenuis]|uniref:Uncharacterized protein n=1 Tax=Parelaphostrongylus tenuis TaxID=148309 RepID=A0AAD5WK83_PARTN|nr:hypothetical protein KIN20_034674 [Parelaphostrongylus tenuis]